MRMKLLAAGVLAGLLMSAGTAAAKPPGVQPLGPDEAAALIGAPSLVSGSSVTRAVTPEEALAAATRPGATVSVAPGLSLEQAVGVAPAGNRAGGSTTSGLRGAVATTAGTGCAANVGSWTWGTWPYDQWITDTTYWCAVYGDHITYRSSSVGAGGTLCGTNSMGNALISGGIGYSWFVIRSSAVYSCPTVIPWITLHPSHYIDISRNAWGNSAIVGTG
jgi:hypothetical protein